MKKYSELLSNAGLFRGIKDNEIEAMLDCLSATVRHYQKGDFVFHRGECITSVAMLLEGCIHIQKEDYSVSVCLPVSRSAYPEPFIRYRF